MNLLFFQLAFGSYLLATAGYIAYFIKPEQKWTATASLWVTVLGFLLHIAYFLLRWTESGRIPITSFFEAANFLGMGIVLVFLIMEFRFKIATLGSFMLPLVIVLMAPALILSGDIKEINPVLKSGWLGVHTSLAVLGDAAFAFAFIVSIMYLIQERQLKSKHLGAIFHRLAVPRYHGYPRLQSIDVRLAPLYTWYADRLYLGEQRLGYVLELGPEGNLVAHYVGHLSRAPASSYHRMAGKKNGLSFDHRLCLCPGQFFCGQPNRDGETQFLR